MQSSAMLESRLSVYGSEFMQSQESTSNRSRYVYVIDDEVQVLEVIAMQLNAAGFTVSTYSAAPEFLRVAESIPAGIVISDQRMPDMDGLNLQLQLQQFHQKFPLIILTGYPETRIAVQAMKQGAVTVLDKPYNKDQLLNAIEEAFEVFERQASDDTHLPPILPNGVTYRDRLSGRESQVVNLVYDGETNKSIGISLGISIKTVEKHRGKAMKKMEVNSLAELIRLIDRERNQH